jgi:hypothetical protein
LTLKTRKSDKHHKKTAIIFKKCFIFDRIKIINTPKKRCHFHKNHLLFGRKRTSINLSLKNREKIVDGILDQKTDWQWWIQQLESSFDYQGSVRSWKEFMDSANEVIDIVRFLLRIQK